MPDFLKIRVYQDPNYKGRFFVLDDFSPIPRDLPEIFLIAVNLIPLVGTLFFGWDPFDIMIAYWFESAVIAAFWFLKSFLFAKKNKYPVILYTPFLLFFIFHFSGFMFGHLIFILVLLGPFQPGKTFSTQEMIVLTKGIFYRILPFVISLIISHGISFKVNFLDKSEYEATKSIRSSILSIYGRVFVMHLSIFVIAYIVLTLKVRALAPALIVLTKILTDLRAHRKEHKKALSPSN